MHGLGADATPRLPSWFTTPGDRDQAEGLRCSLAAGALPAAGFPPDIVLRVYHVLSGGKHDSLMFRSHRQRNEDGAAI